MVPSSLSRLTLYTCKLQGNCLTSPAPAISNLIFEPQSLKCSSNVTTTTTTTSSVVATSTATSAVDVVVPRYTGNINSVTASYAASLNLDASRSQSEGVLSSRYGHGQRIWKKFDENSPFGTVPPFASPTSSPVSKRLIEISQTLKNSTDQLNNVISILGPFAIPAQILIGILAFFADRYTCFKSNQDDAADLAETCRAIASALEMTARMGTGAGEGSQIGDQSIENLTRLLKEVYGYLNDTFGDSDEGSGNGNGGALDGSTSHGNRTWKNCHTFLKAPQIQKKLNEFKEKLTNMTQSIGLVITSRQNLVTYETVSRVEEWVKVVIENQQRQQQMMEQLVDKIQSSKSLDNELTTRQTDRDRVVEIYLQSQQELIPVRQQFLLRNLSVDNVNIVEKMDETDEKMYKKAKQVAKMEAVKAWMLPANACTWDQNPSNVIGGEPGAFVYRGFYMGFDIAVKVFDGDVNMVAGGSWEKIVRQIAKEVDNWQGVSEHPNVVTLLGCSTIGTYYIAMESCKKGTIREYLRPFRGAPQWRQTVIRVLSETISGIQAFHNKSIVHRDLSSTNILVRNDKHNTIALVYSSLSRQVAATVSASSTHLSHRNSKDHRWMSPEQLLLPIDRITTASDIWSFGMVITEILFDVDPFSNVGEKDVAEKLVQWKEGDLLVVPEGKTVEGDLLDVWSIAVDCVRKDPTKRPTAVEIGERLAAAAKIKGTLGEYLRPLRGTPQWPETVIRVLAETISSLETLHAKSVIQRNLSSSNILLLADNTITIANASLHPNLAGLSSFFSQPNDSPTVQRSMSPEQFLKPVSEVTTATDIWSFGILCYEILFDVNPFNDIPDDQVSKVISEWKGGLTRPFAQDWNLGVIWDLAVECVNRDPTKRPTAERIGERLKHTLTAVRGRAKWFANQVNEE
ncbi:hypothetical protein HDU76_009694 [Blyttiomyces sp. JEL0837]|nr:hypothetical protein HDU76_009694 [Blyttiomyces sp. JEL0837]